MRRFLAGIVLSAAILHTVAQNPASVTFRDISADSAVSFHNDSSPTKQKYLPESMVGGVAMFDYDNDGLMDIYFVNGARISDPMPEGEAPDKSDPRYWNRLYHNDGNLKFTDVTEKARVAGEGFGMGVAAGDYDGDGFVDLYITNLNRNILYRNNGDGTFTDTTKSAAISGGGWSASAAFLDYDRDGDLDLFITRYLNWSFSENPYCGEKKSEYRAYCHPDQFQPISHLLYRNNGDGTFTDVSTPSGIAAHPGKGLGVVVNDFNRDGWPDVAVANDSFPQQLFLNRKNGTFAEEALVAGIGYDDDGKTFAGMGIDAADYDRDLWPDAFVNALANQKYALFRNVKGLFEYTTGPTGLGQFSQMHSGWGAKFVDYDNDGWVDIFVAQGHVMDNIELTQPSLRYREPLLLLRNETGKFKDVSMRSGEIFTKALTARGAAFGDLDNDGWIDAVINVKDSPALLLRNQGGVPSHWLTLDLHGRNKNRYGIGALVRIVSEDGAEQRRFVTASGSYMSSNDHRPHFGLGGSKTVKSLEIQWPDGNVQTMESVKADQVLQIKEPESSTPAR